MTLAIPTLFAGLLVAAFVVTAKWLLGPVDLDPVVCGCMGSSGYLIGSLWPERSA